MGAQSASPARRKEGFWQYAKSDAVVRVWARAELCRLPVADIATELRSP